MQKIIDNYVPSYLSKSDKKRQTQNIRKSRKQYKNKEFYERPKVASFKSKSSSHVTRALKKFALKSMKPSQEMARKTRCSLKGLNEIVRKGEGAYYSSGSRPNQTAKSWGYARLASVLTGGPAAKIDRNILEKYCTGY